MFLAAALGFGSGPVTVNVSDVPPIVRADIREFSWGVRFSFAGRTFTTTLWSHAPVAAAFLRMLRNASRTFRAGTGPSGPQSVICPSGLLNQAADGRRHFYWYLPDIAPFVSWRPRGMFSITSCLQCSQDSIVRTVFAGGQI